MTNKTTIQLHLTAESCTIYSSSSRRPVRKILDTPSYKRGVLPLWHPYAFKEWCWGTAAALYYI